LAVEKERAGDDPYLPACFHVDHGGLTRGDRKGYRRQGIAMALGKCVVADGDVKRVAPAIDGSALEEEVEVAFARDWLPLISDADRKIPGCDVDLADSWHGGQGHAREEQE
jgi:hypothetical protein